MPNFAWPRNTVPPKKCCRWGRNKVEDCRFGIVNPDEFYDKREEIALGAVNLIKAKEKTKKKWIVTNYRTSSSSKAMKPDIKIMGNMFFVKQKKPKFRRAIFYEKTKDKNPFKMLLKPCKNKWVYLLNHKIGHSPILEKPVLVNDK